MTPEECTTIEQVGGLLRNVVARPEGLTTIDFSQVEARGLLWLAGDEAGLDDYRNGVDPYKKIAGTIYGVSPASIKKPSPERDTGKLAGLACLAEGTPILTQNGWKPIETVEGSDRVWDGDAWVAHDGVVCNGHKEVISVEGVWLTPDHEVLTDRGWRTASFVALGLRYARGRSSVAGSSSRTIARVRGAIATRDAGASVGERQTSTPATFTVACPPNATSARSGRRPEQTESGQGTRRLFPITGSGECGLAVSLRPSVGARTHQTVDGVTTEEEGSGYTPPGWPTVAGFSPTSRPFRGGTIPGSRSTGSTTVEATSQGTFGVLPRRRRAGTRERTEEAGRLCPVSGVGSCSRNGAAKVASAGSDARGCIRLVYDILNTGPQHRFQAGPLIVHNCGYQGGRNALLRIAAKQRISLAGLDPQAVVEGWRDTYPLVAGERTGRMWEGTACRRGGLWKDLRRALDNRGRAGRCSFFDVPGGVACELPSGRRLLYRDLREEPEGDDGRMILTYANARGTRTKLYAGRICENCVQAICRDLLAEAMLRLDAAGYRIVLHVHDEIVLETRDLESVKRITEQPPAWAAGFPIQAEGAVAERWSK